MRILVLGGTVFVGRHLTELACAAGHEVVHFNRGRTAPGLFPGVETVAGDRARDLGRLAGRRFDAVVDTSGYEPDVVRAGLDVLRGAAEAYAFVSSVSVYGDVSVAGIDESAPVATIPGDELATATRQTRYGELKALCEREVEGAFPGRSLVARPGLIVGPHDPTGRFSYWPHRLADGGEVLAPGSPDAATQVVDVRDLAGWILRSLEGGRTGVFNVVGPAERLSLGGLLETCRRVADSSATLTWVDESFLLAEGVQPWTELPLWLPSAWEDDAGFAEIDGSKALAGGLSLRPLEDTVAATLADTGWARGTSLLPEREAALLRAWRERA